MFTQCVQMIVTQNCSPYFVSRGFTKSTTPRSTNLSANLLPSCQHSPANSTEAWRQLCSGHQGDRYLAAHHRQGWPMTGKALKRQDLGHMGTPPPQRVPEARRSLSCETATPSAEVVPILACSLESMSESRTRAAVSAASCAGGCVHHLS